jgi:hypothetical protein
MTTIAKMNTKLTRSDVQQLADAYRRYAELSTQTLQTPNKDSELAGLRAYLTEKLFTHASEFIGCWIVLDTEYQPLINGFVALQSRANAVLVEAARAQQAERGIKFVAGNKQAEGPTANDKIIPVFHKRQTKRESE